MAADEQPERQDPGPAEYAVGFGKPPLHSRFRKGHSGNPRGRPRRATDLASLLTLALDRPAFGGARSPATKREAIVARLVEKAAEGDLPAARLLFELMRQAGSGGEGSASPEDDPRALLLRKLARLVAAGGGDPPSR